MNTSLRLRFFNNKQIKKKLITNYKNFLTLRILTKINKKKIEK